MESKYTEEALLRVGVVPASLSDTAERSACYSMILRPDFIYLAIFLIFQIWLSDQ